MRLHVDVPIWVSTAVSLAEILTFSRLDSVTSPFTLLLKQHMRMLFLNSSAKPTRLVYAISEQQLGVALKDAKSAHLSLFHSWIVVR